MSTMKPSRSDNSNYVRESELDPKCVAQGTSLCRKFASRGGCETCYVQNMHEDDARKAACDLWNETVRLLPPNIDELSESDVSWFSVGDNPEPADGYAVLDMANPEPYTTKGFFFGYGKKVRTPVGSLVTLHIAIGKRARRAFRTVDVLRLGCFVGSIALALILLSIPAIAEPMVNAFVLLPAVFLVLMGVMGHVVGRSLARWYMRRYSSTVNFRVEEVPLVADMLRRNWYFFQTDNGVPRMTFSKKNDFGPLLPPID